MSALQKEIDIFVKGSSAGFAQLLVAAATPSTFGRIISCPTYPVALESRELATAVQCFLEAKHSRKIHFPSLLARTYFSTQTTLSRKGSGQFFTAESVARWALTKLGPKSNDVVCDAGAGSAVFGHGIIESGFSVNSYTGVESDPLLALCSAHTVEGVNAPSSFKIWYANFLLLDETSFLEHEIAIPNVIISNPPFVRFQNLSGRNQIRASLKSRLGISLSSFAGSGSYFLAKAAELALAGEGFSRKIRKGRLAFFSPIEAAGSAHAQHLRRELNIIHGWNANQYAVPDVQTGVDRHASNALALLYVFDRNEKTFSALKPQEQEHRPQLKDVVKVRRGISTGRNEFFVLSDSEVVRRKLPLHRLCKILPTRIALEDKNFTEQTWDQLRQSGRPCWLLALPPAAIEDFEIPVQQYLKEGIQHGVHTTPTAKSYRYWFSIPVPATPPDVFITYIFRGVPRFILNSAQVFNLTNILGGRFYGGVQQEQQEALVDSLNSAAVLWTKGEVPGREYKGGLRKIEPRELAGLPISAELLNFAKSVVNADSPQLFL